MIAVYHNDQFLLYGFLDETQYREAVQKLKPQNLVKVALVDTNSLDDAFRLTNHIDHNWTKNAGVQVLQPGRSTSVGDLLVKNDECWFVSTVGFIQMKGFIPPS